MKIKQLLEQMEAPKFTRLPSFKKVREMKSPIVLQGECCGITVTAYETGFITCVNEYGDATVFTETVRFTTEDRNTQVVKLSELDGELNAVDVLSSIGCSRIDHNRSVRTQRKEKRVYDEERDEELSVSDTYSFESENEQAERQKTEAQFNKLLTSLTDAQLEVAELLMHGCNINEIATKLKISRTSVNDRISGIKKKFQKIIKKEIYMGDGGWCRTK